MKALRTTKEQKERLLRWVRALESGRYEQATGALRTDVGYCCLGVACAVLRKDTVGKWIRQTDGYYEEYRFVSEGSKPQEGHLPPKIRGMLGISEAFMNKLIELNDTGDDFTQIASEIRKKYNLGDRKKGSKK